MTGNDGQDFGEIMGSDQCARVSEPLQGRLTVSNGRTTVSKTVAL
jgi:hypothetical protein